MSDTPAPFWRRGTSVKATLKALLETDTELVAEAYRRAHAFAVLEIECNCPLAGERHGRRYRPVDENRQPVGDLADASSSDLRADVEWLVRHGLARVEADKLGTVIVLDYQPEDLE